VNESLHWKLVNADLIAKAIGELVYEQVFSPLEANSGFSLTLKSGVTYTFKGWKTLWDYMRVDSKSLLRNGDADIDASTFFLDIQEETGMDDIILGNFFEEMQNTLWSDLRLKKRNLALSSREIAEWSGEKIQSILNGHPKILLNKGRVGWNGDDHEKYAPESDESFQLYWIAIKRELASIKGEDNVLEESFTSSELDQFKKLLELRDIKLDNYFLMPVHPWQWNRFIQLQFAREIALKNIISIGEFGDFYKPQISIRTLSNVSRPLKMDIKLPLSILNTSCIRGLPHKHVMIGPAISETLATICKNDSKLQNVKILKERTGVTVKHEAFTQIQKAPYRYHEFLGVVWRESSASLIAPNEKAILTASLFHQDSMNQSLIGEYIKKSGKSQTEWLKAFFQEVIVPLYHLQVEYGLGLVAHGQNVVLILRDSFPAGMILKDFHGDLRLSTKLPELGEKYFGAFKDELTTLPPHYLIHDLITGQLITVQRFISAVMQESNSLNESEYYSLMAQVLQKHNRPEADLFAETFERLLLNKVRFKIGYADSDQRPLPVLGTTLKNPLFPFKRAQL
jgi:aerobactin synthase